MTTGTKVSSMMMRPAFYTAWVCVYPFLLIYTQHILMELSGPSKIDLQYTGLNSVSAKLVDEVMENTDSQLDRDETYTECN